MTRAIILAAGQGTRLRPLTDKNPKSMVSLIGKPLLERQLATLNGCDVKDVAVVTGYCADKIKNIGVRTFLNPLYEKTNMVYSLFAAESFMSDTKGEDLLICYGDIVYQRDNLQTILDSSGDIAVMVDKNWHQYWSLRMDNPLDDAETLILDENKYITELGKKTDNYKNIQGQYTGLIKISSDKIKDLISFYHGLDRGELYDGKDFENMYMTSFLQLLINGGWKIKAAIVENGWLEVDTVEDLELYESMAKENKLGNYYDEKKC